VSIKPPLRSYSFSADSRCSLRKLGLIDEQLAELEKVLPFCRLDIEDAAPLGDVRSELQSVDATRRLYTAASPSLREALNRMQMASHQTGGDCREIEHAQSAVAALNDVLGKALDDLPKEQRRTMAASPQPIERVYHALVLGWGRGGGGRAFNLAPEPEYRDRMAHVMRTARAEATRKFEAIVQVCYETIGAPRDYCPERAIKSFRRLQRADDARRAAMVQEMRNARSSENLTSRP
jgi:hypothetical protein